MNLEAKLEALVARAKEHDRIANSGEAECTECEWREAYCLMEIAFRAQKLAREADVLQAAAEYPNSDQMLQMLGEIRAEAERLIDRVS